MRPLASRAKILALIPILSALSACGDDDPVSPGTVGRAQAIVRDDPDRAAALVAAATIGEAPFAAPAYSGSFTSNTNVAISADGQTWVDLGSPNGITIKLHSRDSTTVHGEVDVPVGTYAHVRVTLRTAQARIAAGGSVGGITLATELSLTLGGSDAQVVVQKQVQPFQVSAGSRTAIVFELNSEAWATAQNAQDRMVDDAEVQASAAVAIRSGV
jgi:hypothetical protein